MNRNIKRLAAWVLAAATLTWGTPAFALRSGLEEKVTGDLANRLRPGGEPNNNRGYVYSRSRPPDNSATSPTVVMPPRTVIPGPPPGGGGGRSGIPPIVARTGLEETGYSLQLIPAAPQAILQSGMGASIKSLAFSPDGGTLFSVTESGAVRAWEVKESHPRWTFFHGRSRVSSIAVSPDGETVAITFWPERRSYQTVQLLDARTGSVIPESGEGPLLPYPIRGLSFTPDGQKLIIVGTTQLVSVDVDTKLGLVSARTEEKSFPEEVSLFGRAVAFSPDGKSIAVSAEKSADVFGNPFEVSGTSSATPVVLEDQRQNFPTVASAFTPDGKRVVTISERGRARVFEVATGERLQSFKVLFSALTGSRGTNSVAISSQGLLALGKNAGIYLFRMTEQIPAAGPAASPDAGLEESPIAAQGGLRHLLVVSPWRVTLKEGVIERSDLALRERTRNIRVSPIPSVDLIGEAFQEAAGEEEPIDAVLIVVSSIVDLGAVQNLPKIQSDVPLGVLVVAPGQVSLEAARLDSEWEKNPLIFFRHAFDLQRPDAVRTAVSEFVEQADTLIRRSRPVAAGKVGLEEAGAAVGVSTPPAKTALPPQFVFNKVAGVSDGVISARSAPAQVTRYYITEPWLGLLVPAESLPNVLILANKDQAKYLIDQRPELRKSILDLDDVGGSIESAIQYIAADADWREAQPMERILLPEDQTHWPNIIRLWAAKLGWEVPSLNDPIDGNTVLDKMFEVMLLGAQP